MRKWLKWALIIVVGMAALNSLERAFSNRSAGATQSSDAPHIQTAAEKKNEQGCRAWLLTAATKGYLPSLDAIKVDGEFGVLVNPGPWALLSFEQKTAIVENFECLGFHGEDKRAELSVFDAKTHRRLATYNGIALRVE